MVKTRSLQVRLTRDQHERITNYAKLKGFTSLASYIRYVALDQEWILRQRIFEIHHHLLGHNKEKKTSEKRE